MNSPTTPAPAARSRARTDADTARLSATERCLSAFTALRPGEGASALLFFLYAFLLLICYYVLKTIREPLLLEGGSAEQKSYAYAAIAVVLLFLVPLYGVLFRRVDPHRLVRSVTLLFASTLAVFYALGRAGFDVGFAYYVFVGVFGVTVLAQFWGHAAHSFDTGSGQRLFPVIMAGAALGAVAGPPLSSSLYRLLGPFNLMTVAFALLVATLPLVGWTAASVPAGSRGRLRPTTAPTSLLGGFGLVLSDRYLKLLATLAVLLNCVNTTGEYILTKLVVEYAEQRVALEPDLATGDLIAAFYGNYYLAVNALGVLLQIGVVARLFRYVGVNGALLVLPIIALIGYGLIVCVPFFAVIRAVKILENSVDYSIMNTARHALYLPLPAAHQFEGKTAIDTFFWRLGDVVQAGVIYVGVHQLGFGVPQFALLNMGLAAVWLCLAICIGRHYAHPVRRRRTGARAGAASRLTAVALALSAVAAPVRAAPVAAEPLFGDDAPLLLELEVDLRGLCRSGDGCEASPAALSERRADGTRRTASVTVRARGKWRKDRSHCSVPPLFVFFDASSAGSSFAGQGMLPLTTHCRDDSARYEQYVLTEYLAYRIYGLLTDKSLKARLARVRYTDTGRRRPRTVERYAFFTEHFESLARRHAAELAAPPFEPRDADPLELATFDVFQFLIGNTDWSAVQGHNVTHLREATGRITPVPYDFDFAGLVDADYAGPPPGLPIRSVTQRLFRGFCQPDIDWSVVFERFAARRDAIMALVEETPGLNDGTRRDARAYLEEFFGILDSAPARQDEIVGACRPGGV